MQYVAENYGTEVCGAGICGAGKYIAEILADNKVWLISCQRDLLSIHFSLSDAEHCCFENYHDMPVAVDRRAQFTQRS